MSGANRCPRPGMKWKMRVNKADVPATDSRKSSACNIHSGIGSAPPMNLPIAASAALSSSDTSSSKPIASTSPMEKNRRLHQRENPAAAGRVNFPDLVECRLQLGEDLRGAE